MRASLTPGYTLHALRSITEASTISFVDTKEVEQQHGHLARMQGELERAMEDERYEEASRIKEEIKMMLLPSQQPWAAGCEYQARTFALHGALAESTKQPWRAALVDTKTLLKAALSQGRR